MLRDSTSLQAAPDGNRFGVFVSQKLQPWRPLTLEVGARYDRQSYIGDEQVSPRFNLAYSPTSRLTLRGAWGVFAQSQRIYQLSVQDGDDDFYPAERAEHIGVGLETRVRGDVQLRVEAYTRGLSHMRPRYFNLTDQVSPVGEAEPDRVTVTPERGRSRGIELLLQRTAPRYDWSVGYTLAQAEDQVAERWVPRALDQRHAVNLVVGFRPKPDWSIGGSWQYHSGWPATQQTFRAEQVGNSLWAITSFEEWNGDRLPSYQRIDLRATRLFQIGDQRISLYLDVFNALNHKNAEGYEYSIFFSGGQMRSTQGYESLLPRIPTIGINWEF